QKRSLTEQAKASTRILRRQLSCCVRIASGLASRINSINSSARERLNDLEMDEYTKRLAEEVGTAINESVQNSASVAAAIDRLREAGFEMELTLRLEIGLRPQRENQEETGTAEGFELTEDDLRVLRSMKIKIDSEE